MDFKTILENALKACGEHADDPFLLYCAICDERGNDYALSSEAEAFHRFDKTYGLVREMKRNPEPKMIGQLLERCKEQDDAPIKQCLHWIHALFVYYYRNTNVPEDKADQVIKSLEADYFEPVQEGLKLPKPKQKKTPGKREQAAKTTVKATPAPTNPPPQSPAPAKAANRQLPKVQAQPKPRAVKKPKKLPSVITVVPAANGKAPYIKSLRPIEPNFIPISAYNVLPDDTIVFKSGTAPHLHVCGKCANLRYAKEVYKGKYSKAREADFVRMYGYDEPKLAQHHIPPLCPRCADFIPENSGRFMKYKRL